MGPGARQGLWGTSRAALAKGWCRLSRQQLPGLGRAIGMTMPLNSSYLKNNQAVRAQGPGCPPLGHWEFWPGKMNFRESRNGLGWKGP